MHQLALSIVTSELGLKIGETLYKNILDAITDQDIPVRIIHEGNVKEAPESTLNIVLVATGGTENLIAELAEKSEYLYILYTDKYNSLPATIEALAYLKSRNRKVRAVRFYDNDQLRYIISKLKRVSDAYRKIRTSKFGVIGGVSPWLIYSKTDENVVNAKGLGKLVYIPIEELYNEVKNVFVDQYLIQKTINNAKEIELDNVEENVSKALKVYFALKNLVKKYELSGFTIKCFDLIKILDTTACLAVSYMNSESLPATCEGDIPLLYTMAIATWSTGRPVFMANPAYIEGDEVIFAHCASPLIGEYGLYTHFESGRGVGIKVTYPVGGKITIFRLKPDLSVARIGVGEIQDHTWSKSMCRTQVKVKVKNASKIIHESFGNHYALVLGDHVDELTLISELLNFKIDLL
ncbi:MAG: hypothetical protein QXW93_04770 [Desulfurococcaceae archaeon]